MGFDNRPRDRQSHPHAALLCCKKRFKDLLQTIRLDSLTCIRNRELRLVLEEICPDRNSAIAAMRCCKRVDGIGDQVKNDLLQLNAVTLDNQGMRSERRIQV